MKRPRAQQHDLIFQPSRTVATCREDQGRGGTWWGWGQPVGGWDRPLGTSTLPPAAPSPRSPQPLLAFILSQLPGPGSEQGEERIETVLGAMGGAVGSRLPSPCNVPGSHQWCRDGDWARSVAQGGTWPKSPKAQSPKCLLSSYLVGRSFGGMFLWCVSP